MKSLWNNQQAQALGHDLEIRAYSSRLLGQEESLVLHGGGNTSVKIMEKNLFGEEELILWVKGSGHDLKTISANGFSPCKMDHLLKLANLDELSDEQMMKELKLSMTSVSAPTPSVEAILHALIPHKYVDHTHTDAVVTISNTPNGENILREIYGKEVLILPYIMPGFILAKQVQRETRGLDWKKIKGIFLLHHGLFTFHDDAKTSYENMIELVDRAENFLNAKVTMPAPTPSHTRQEKLDRDLIAKYRKAAIKQFGAPLVMSFRQDPLTFQLCCDSNFLKGAFEGPITPDHVLHTKRIPMLCQGNPEADVESFAQNYRQYFENNNSGDKTILDSAPRVGIFPQKGIFHFAPNPKRLKIVEDIYEHTMLCVYRGQQLGGWRALSPKDIFDLEYWELEQAKLKVQKSSPVAEGQIVLVTGAASGIGRACVLEFLARGAAVVGADINPSVKEVSSSAQYRAFIGDLTVSENIDQLLNLCAHEFGGLDILVSNAGNFPASTPIENTTDQTWDQILNLNLDSHFKLLRKSIELLKHGYAPNILFVASKNVPAPGPGVASYSVAKAALTQLARVAAIELGEFGIRVNTVHPNAVFDTGLWNKEVIEKRAHSYNLSVEEYKKKNVLKVAITSKDVALMIADICGPHFSKTTGLQATIDGGDLRVI